MVSVPGKSILMGEHAAVYDRPALVAAIDRRLSAAFVPEEGADPGLLLDLRDLGIRRRVDWDEIRAYGERADADFCAFRNAPDPAHFARLRGEDPAHVVLIAVAMALGVMSPPRSARLEVRSDLPIGAGFGSSAATSVAVLAAMFSVEGGQLDLIELEGWALEVEKRQHGTPSGVDGATVIRGGLLWVERHDGRLQALSLPGVAPAFFDRLRLFHSGRPAEATGDVVAAVHTLRLRNPQAFERRLDLMATLSAGLRDTITAPSPEWPRVVETIRAFEVTLEELGVVPAPIREIIRRIEAEGGAAKISGAGSLAGPGAGSLMVFHPEPAQIPTWEFLSGLEALELRLGGPGLAFS